MATIDVRKGPEGKVVYRARVPRKGYATHTATFTTRAEARKWITITEGAIFAQRHFPTKAATQQTLGDAIERYVREILPQKRRNTMSISNNNCDGGLLIWATSCLVISLLVSSPSIEIPCYQNRNLAQLCGDIYLSSPICIPLGSENGIGWRKILSCG
jgi:hypothetical protein